MLQALCLTARSSYDVIEDWMEATLLLPDLRLSNAVWPFTQIALGYTCWACMQDHMPVRPVIVNEQPRTDFSTAGSRPEACVLSHRSGLPAGTSGCKRGLQDTSSAL